MQRPEPGKPRNQLSKGSPVNTNDSQTHQVLQGWRDEDGNVDLDAVRSGTVDVRHSDAILAALLDEVEERRAGEDLLREVGRALTVPLPARTVEAEREYLWVLARRASVVKESVEAALNPEDAADFAMAARNVRTQAPLQIALYQIRESGDVR